MITTIRNDSIYWLSPATAQTAEAGPLPGIPAARDADRVAYCGNVVYDHGQARLMTGVGYVTFGEDREPRYHYFLRDHAGNVRVVMGQDGQVEQVNHYYAFGGIMRESVSPGVQPYKFGGKELDRTGGLDAYDFGARMYFADRLQWGQLDPECEGHYAQSPYMYCGANPFGAVDPNGRDWYELNGNVYWRADVVSAETVPEGGVYIGEEYMGLTVIEYHESDFNNEEERGKLTDEEVENGNGLTVRIQYHSQGEEIKKTRWVQNVMTNYYYLDKFKRYKDPEKGKGIFYV